MALEPWFTLSWQFTTVIVETMNRHRKTAVFALVSAGLARFCVLALLAGAGLRAWGSGISVEYLTDVWTADDSLPDSSVTDIAQTPDGYLWIGTYNGLARFDGMRFVTFDPANTPALAHARVRTLSVDDQGTLWINTFDGSMTSLRQGTFAREWTGAEGLDPDVTLVSSRSNQVTFLMHRGFLRRKPQFAPAETGWEDLYPTNRSVGTLCVEDGGGTIWYRGSDRLLWRVTDNGFESQTNGLAGSRVNCMTTDPQGRLWVIGSALIEEGDAQVVMGLGVIRFEANGFLKLADRVVGLEFVEEGSAEIVVGLSVIRFEADGFLKLAGCLASLAFFEENDANVVMGLGILRIDADGFLELSHCFFGPALVEKKIANVIIRDVIVLRDFGRVPEKGFTVFPIPELLPRQCKAENDHC